MLFCCFVALCHDRAAFCVMELRALLIDCATLWGIAAVVMWPRDGARLLLCVMAGLLFVSWPGLSRPPTSSFASAEKAVGSRHKAGHDTNSVAPT
jgi:hypothetical protein